jgi:hypothetical protein
VKRSLRIFPLRKRDSQLIGEVIRSFLLLAGIKYGEDEHEKQKDFFHVLSDN